MDGVVVVIAFVALLSVV